jgi:hypothetical protein
MSALALGCSGSPDGDFAEEDLRVPVQPLGGVIGANGMDPVDFWAPSARSALRTLGGGALVGTNGALVATPLLDTAGGSSVLEYAVRCALPEGATVTHPSGLTFQGSYGLAPSWTGRGLVTSEQRWVTACLLQHLNGLGATVDVMLEGSHPALDPRPGEDISDFTVKDATMFGNVFVTGLTAYACFNLDLQPACVLDLSLHTLERICGLSLTCGATILGLCELTCTDDSNGDPSCRPLLVGPSYPQAIRTKVQDTDLLSLYPGCDLL